MLPHSPGEFITDVEQFSIMITFRIMSFSVFTVAWPNETVLQLKLRGPLLCSSCFQIWAGHKGISLRLSSFLAGNDFLLNSLVKHRSDTPSPSPLPVWCFSCTTLSKSIPLSVWTATSYSWILDPNLGQSSLFFPVLKSFLHCLFLLPGTIRLVWLGFA